MKNLVETKMKKITIMVTNAELDALEDYLTVDYHKAAETINAERDRQRVLRLFGKICKEFDK